jgi:hypothetical protein
VHDVLLGAELACERAVDDRGQRIDVHTPTISNEAAAVLAGRGFHLAPRGTNASSASVPSESTPRSRRNRCPSQAGIPIRRIESVKEVFRCLACVDSSATNPLMRSLPGPSAGRLRPQRTDSIGFWVRAPTAKTLRQNSAAVPAEAEDRLAERGRVRGAIQRKPGTAAERGQSLAQASAVGVLAPSPKKVQGVG